MALLTDIKKFVKMLERLFVILFVLLVGHSNAQEPAKKALKIDDFASWNTIPSYSISNDGKIVVYEQNPQKGDGALHIVKGNYKTTIDRATKAQIGSENDCVVFHIKPSEGELRKAKKDKVKKDKMPKDSLGIFFFKHHEILKYSKVKSFQLAEENAEWIAFTREAKELKNDSTAEKKEKQPGDDLFILNIHSKDSLVIQNVIEYAWAKEGKALICVQQTKDSTHTSSTLIRFDSDGGITRTIHKADGWIKKAILDETAEQCAFLFSKDTSDIKTYASYLVDNANIIMEVVNEKTNGVPVGWAPSENGKVYFSEDGSKLYLGTALIPEEEPKDTLLAEEKPKVDVWNWKDEKLQPQQLLEAEKEKKRTFLGVYDMKDKSYVQLADLFVKEVSTIQKGNSEIAFGSNDSPYLRASSWTGLRLRDYYLIDLKTGIKREILTGKSHARISPQGKYVIWYEPQDSSYYSVSTDINNIAVVSLTKKIPVSFYDEWNDRPTDSYPYGIAGWSEDDRFVYIYDRYDIWKIDPTDERVPVNMTKAFGRRNITRLRYQKLDKDLEYIPNDETILLSGIDERTKSIGYFETKLNTVKDPGVLLMGKFRVGGVKKAKEADKMVWHKQNIKTYPDIWQGNTDFSHGKRISDANPQQKEFLWADVELVRWTSFTGETLSGLLYKPENLKENDKYPMIVYFYERSSEGLFSHIYPRPSRSTINRTFYASNGYLVFVPDITYKNGYPGQSAYNAIVSGTQFLINNYEFVDQTRIGLQGQSWGGYQTAWLITQTDLYAAAMAGAPVSNMTSAYGGIRWGSGRSRMFQYEHTQSRIGGTLWEKPLLYVENSPLFYVPKINTPLLIMHNDKDGAVPWYQGIELFVALRRLDKPVWMLNYNGMEHNLPAKAWANRIDLSTRMFQFFNHYLKSRTAPEWMEFGVPAVEKGKKLGY